MQEHKKGSQLDVETFAAYVMAQRDAKVDTTSDPYLITLFRPGRAPERWELKKPRRKRDVYWQRR